MVTGSGSLRFRSNDRHPMERLPQSDSRMENTRQDEASAVAKLRTRLERLRVELERREGELAEVCAEKARLELVLEAFEVAFAELDPELCYVHVNEQGARLAGHGREELLGVSLLELFPELKGETLHRALVEGLKEGASARFEQYLRPRKRWFEGRVTPVPGGVLLVGIDITERKRGERALREATERFELAARAVRSVIYDWDYRTHHIQRTEGLFDLVGYRPEESEPTPEWWNARVHPEDLERLAADVEDILANRERFVLEYRLRHRDGHYVDVWDHGVVVRNRKGEIVRIVGNSINVTSRKRAEEELNRAKEAAEEANRVKDRFLATLSHELRTPLTPVLAVASALEQDGRLAPIHPQLAMIRRNVELEARLIDDLLDLTRIARGWLEVQAEWVDVRRVVEQTAEACWSQDASPGRSSLVRELDAADHRVWADPSRLTQVLWNLLNNAVKFTPPGGTVTVRTRLEEGGRWLVLEVADTGIGIEPERLEQVFDAFEQGEIGASRRYGGLGLGLSISQAIVQRHGGTLRADSEGLGRGSTFTLRLPVAPPRSEPASPPATEAGAEPAAAAGLDVLLVEDHRDTAEAMAALLELLGHRVTVAHCAAEARAAAEGREGGFDLLLSDLGLPDGSGHDLMRELASKYGVRGIALSGYGTEEDLERSRRAGFERHLTKPVNLDDLSSALRQVVPRRGESRW
jgi:PAS domain S-box-containing protein